MNKKEAEYIVLCQIYGWLGLLANTREDFFDSIPAQYLIDTKPNDGHEHYATAEERELIKSIAIPEWQKIIKRMRRIENSSIRSHLNRLKGK